jgi:hypothetical protein
LCALKLGVDKEHKCISEGSLNVGDKFELLKENDGQFVTVSFEGKEFKFISICSTEIATSMCNDLAYQCSQGIKSVDNDFASLERKKAWRELNY